MRRNILLITYQVLEHNELGIKLKITNKEVFEWITSNDQKYWNVIENGHTIWPWYFEVTPPLLTLIHMKYA